MIGVGAEVHDYLMNLCRISKNEVGLRIYILLNGLDEVDQGLMDSLSFRNAAFYFFHGKTKRIPVKSEDSFRFRGSPEFPGVHTVLPVTDFAQFLGLDIFGIDFFFLFFRTLAMLDFLLEKSGPRRNQVLEIPKP